MKVIKDKIFVIENFISQNTAEFIVKDFSANLETTQHDGIYTGGGKGEGQAQLLSGEYKIAEYDGKKDISIDLLTSLCASMEKTMSKIHGKNMTIKSIFYSHMKEGGKNDLHYDTYTEEYSNDYSGLLYLTDTYFGGLLNFPDLEVSLHPSAGTFVTFFGTEDMKHEVQKVISGDRVNLICFFN
jgi:hypothetical protein